MIILIVGHLLNKESDSQTDNFEHTKTENTHAGTHTHTYCLRCISTSPGTFPLLTSSIEIGVRDPFVFDTSTGPPASCRSIFFCTPNKRRKRSDAEQRTVRWAPSGALPLTWNRTSGCLLSVNSFLQSSATVDVSMLIHGARPAGGMTGGGGMTSSTTPFFFPPLEETKIV